MQCKCRNKLKRFTREMAREMPVESLTHLMDFGKTHPEIFGLLWCQYAHTMFATRIIETVHGFQRDSYGSQQAFARNNVQLRYITSTVYISRDRLNGEQFTMRRNQMRMKTKNQRSSMQSENTLAEWWAFRRSN